MIVVDLGCHTHRDQDSITPLIARYNPLVLYGFDPHPDTRDTITRINKTTVIVARKAAWTVDGNHHLAVDGTATKLDGQGDVLTQTFDLAAWLFVLPRLPTILKLDVEGAEYDLLPHLRHRQADELLDGILIEWHGEPLSIDLACPVEDWH